MALQVKTQHCSCCGSGYSFGAGSVPSQGTSRTTFTTLSIKYLLHWSSHHGAVETIQLGAMRLWVQSLALLSGLRIWHCHELWCRSQTQLIFGIAVAVVSSSSGKVLKNPFTRLKVKWRHILLASMERETF